jgi:hypothetical protein
MPRSLLEVTAIESGTIARDGGRGVGSGGGGGGGGGVVETSGRGAAFTYQ